MKKTNTLVFLALIGAIAFASCSKDSTTTTQPNNNPTTSTTKENMSAKIEGAAFSRDTCIFYFQNAYDTTNALILDWPSFPASGPNYYPLIEMSIEDYHGIGTYTLYGNNYAELLNEHSLGGVGSYAEDGYVVVTAIYPYVVGTFHFTTAAGMAVTDGNFVAKRI
ncbi:MAG: hypothetical protein JWQ38_465 [Flavipsychrobacter sp.]|nr:hypothetical protein [Flavipsychrobacter sp.]